MKINILFLFAFFLIGQNANSQNILGFKAGLNLAHQTFTSSSSSGGTQTQQTKSLIGYRFGIFYKAKIEKRLSFSTEANLSIIGAKQLYVFLNNGSLSEQYVNDRVGYVEVPLLIQYDLKRFYISAGPAISFKLFSQSSLPNNTLYYKSVDVAGVLLGGCRLSKKWDINFDYSYGVVNINKYTGTTRNNKYYSLSLLYTL